MVLLNAICLTLYYKSSFFSFYRSSPYGRW